MNKSLIAQRLPFSFEGIDEDIGRLGSLLHGLKKTAGLKFHGKLTVLNLACGRADETGVLISALDPARVAFYLGVDLRADAIEEARRRWDLMGGEIEFREGNAALLGRDESLPEFDLVFIRHQNYWHEPLIWEGILDEALEALADDGYIACNSYFDQEHEIFMASMRARGARLLANIRHPHSRVLSDAEGKSVDRWIAVWSK